MFEMGDEFFQSLNMTKLPQTFWEKSILEKPDDGRDLICHASAWDFSKPDDVRIKQCTRVTMDQFFTVHHELGHIQYYLQYQHLPSVYRSGANPGFHEAVGDVLSLSVSTPKHLEKIGLLKDFVMDEESKLNQFYQAGLSKLVFLPFAYTLDKYRWGIFRGDIKPEEYNCKFWEMRSKYSGVEPPVVRSEADFDAPAKYHVSADVEYLRYFVSYIIQFQFHRAACEKAGEYVKGDPEKTLNNCDIYQSAEAGNAIKAMLELGSSKPWPDAMEVLTGERKMSADALIEYFQPLYDWLVVENERIGAYVGWEETDSKYEMSNGNTSISVALLCVSIFSFQSVLWSNKLLFSIELFTEKNSMFKLHTKFILNVCVFQTINKRLISLSLSKFYSFFTYYLFVAPSVSNFKSQHY
uniref:Angiotensin-converting enzyme n=1 Tax=Anopheles epiroticus TaxID=199890 RepID=A0A240PNG2_9DIPT